jgi:hypothetical protein
MKIMPGSQPPDSSVSAGRRTIQALIFQKSTPAKRTENRVAWPERNPTVLYAVPPATSWSPALDAQYSGRQASLHQFHNIMKIRKAFVMSVNPGSEQE